MNTALAEFDKLLTRLSVRVALIMAIGIGIAGPMLLLLVGQSSGTVNGTEMSDMVHLTPTRGLAWSLEIRNFFFLRAMIILAAAQCFAGELQAGTLRDDMTRPVSRASLLAGKWFALSAWIGLTVLFQALVSGLLSVILFGMEGDWGAIALGYIATWAADTGFALFVVCVAVWLRSVAATIAGVFLFLVLDTLLGWVVWIASNIVDALPPEMNDLPFAAEALLASESYLPSSAFGAWSGYAEAVPWEPTSLAVLAGISVLSMVLAERRFHYLDVP